MYDGGRGFEKSFMGPDNNNIIDPDIGESTYYIGTYYKQATV